MDDRETANTKFLKVDIKGPSSDYDDSDVDEALLEASQTALLPVHATAADNASIGDAGTDYGSDLDSEAEEEVTKLLAELDSVNVVTEPIIEEENESGRKRLAHVPNFSSQSDSKSTRRSSWHTAPERPASVAATEDTVAFDFDLPDLATRKSSSSHHITSYFSC
jgi:hypothetical protein